MVNIWVVSDTHFGHGNIIKYCGRPFRDADHWTEYAPVSLDTLIAQAKRL